MWASQQNVSLYVCDKRQTQNPQLKNIKSRYVLNLSCNFKHLSTAVSFSRMNMNRNGGGI